MGDKPSALSLKPLSSLLGSGKVTGGVLVDLSSPQGDEPSSASRSKADSLGEAPELMVAEMVIGGGYAGGTVVTDEGGCRWWLTGELGGRRE